MADYGVAGWRDSWGHQDRVALFTGADSGIGRAAAPITKPLAGHSYAVAIGPKGKPSWLTFSGTDYHTAVTTIL